MTLHLLTAPTSLGNRPYESDGTARHTDRGPARLREHRLVERLGANDLGDVAAAPYRDFVRPPGASVRNEDLVRDHVQRIARAIPRDGFTLVLGGDPREDHDGRGAELLVSILELSIDGV